MAPPERMHRLSDRAFGFTFAGLFSLIFIIGWAVFEAFPLWAIGCALVFAFIAALKPGLLLPLNRLWTGVVAPKIALLTNTVVLATMFYVIVTPLGLVLKKFRKDPLNRTLDRAQDSYWSPVAQRRNREHFFDLF